MIDSHLGVWFEQYRRYAHVTCDNYLDRSGPDEGAKTPRKTLSPA